jgi:heparan sulfate 2-O-sulfotransferase HS2ST1
VLRRESGKAHIKRTNHKKEISALTEGRMTRSKVWQLEEDFYQFALTHFKAVKRSVLEQQTNKSHYVYEKVRQVKTGAVIS